MAELRLDGTILIFVFGYASIHSGGMRSKKPRDFEWDALLLFSVAAGTKIGSTDRRSCLVVRGKSTEAHSPHAKEIMCIHTYPLLGAKSRLRGTLYKCCPHNLNPTYL